MTGKRFLEITAKSEQEARELVRLELNADEVISNTEILAAPARGIFALVGNPEVKVRFTVESKPQTISPDEFEKESVSDDYEADDDLQQKKSSDSFTGEILAQRPSRSPRPAAKRPRPERRPRRDDDYSYTPGPPIEKLPLSAEIEAHQFRPVALNIIGQVAENLGVENVALQEYMANGAWVIDAVGDNISQLIGKRGRTLDALQFILNIGLNKGQPEERIKLVLDVAGYREKRLRGLIQLANRMYTKVLDTSRQVELEPMSTLDRRTVHLALKDKDGIETFSKGVEPMRRVVISPRKVKTRAPGWQSASKTEAAQSEGESQSTGSRGRSVPMFIEEDQGHEV